jgi:2-amino-4-hydroxy-6-hydroxymethyldihydropteridine diphosphokinase
LKTVYLSIGSNLGNREEALQQAIDLLLASGVRILRVSAVYETEPVGVRHQPLFLNLVLEGETELFPRQLLARVQRIEKDLGRKRVVPKGPRSIDIDILLFGATVMQIPELTIPHPRMHERRFVLEPLAELAPDLRHPVSRRTVREMLGGVMDQTARKVTFRPAPAGQ